ncbi:hypothetical protein Nos7524_2892 [Nostoc sp. PCC 7524]|uniref:HetP family heterocyst commitment protein n=1 Tax=Nostoc sp. (strain ATCC 29411 / PCC 7524) TaxID=28072 RepID=UPI00029EF09B|nr:HetP family heterocyst commitment protein [Nostoc sp. PCC 7524]AFY48708.1 hypothetical protein Nos7524_2892 [Nostoc sp. PCC 7524]
MNHHIHSSHKSFQNAITIEQLNQIIEAITDGRYSWACVLMLRFVGYNPLHFIPQRTYSRLMKENRQVPSIQISQDSHISSSNNRNSSPVVSKIDDLDHLESGDTKQAKIPVRNSPATLETKMAEFYRQHN